MDGVAGEQRQRRRLVRVLGRVRCGNLTKDGDKTDYGQRKLVMPMLWRAPWLRHRVALVGFAAWDAASLYVSYNLTYLNRLGRWEGLSIGLAVMSATWLGASYLIGRYSPSEKIGKERIYTRLVETLTAGAAVVAVFIGHSWLYQVMDAQTRFRGFLLPVVISTCFLSILGLAVKKGFGDKQILWLVVGREKEKQTIQAELGLYEGLKTKVTVSIWKDKADEILAEVENTGAKVAVGTIDGTEGQIVETLLKLKEKGCYVIPLLSWCEQELQRIPPELVHPEWLVNAEGFALRPGSMSWRIKRFGDVFGGISLIVITLPILIIGGLFVWLEDRGPVFYTQVRSGLYGVPIRIWKLRSMKIDAEQFGARWASKSDPRITRVGRALRATRIDELPQLFNVLKGDLSLIGPRPERPSIEEKLEMKIPNYRVRHWIRPGMSGWAQVCYPYGASIEDSRMKLSYDLYYIRNANIFLDILITLKTIRLVASAQGAQPYNPPYKEVEGTRISQD